MTQTPKEPEQIAFDTAHSIAEELTHGGYADQVSVLKASMQIAGAIRDALARNGHSRETFPTWILRQYADEALSDAGFPGAP